MEADEKNCPKCAESVKAAALVCKHCGYNFLHNTPVSSSSAVKSSKKKKIVVAAAFVVAVPIVLTAIVANSTQYPSTVVPGNNAMTADSSTAAPSHSGANNAPVTEISARKLDAAYHANEPAAQARFGSGPLIINGIVKSINLDFENKPYLELDGQNMFLGPQAHLAESEKDKSATLSKGQKVKLACANASMMASILTLADCTLQ